MVPPDLQPKHCLDLSMGRRRQTSKKQTAEAHRSKLRYLDNLVIEEGMIVACAAGNFLEITDIIVKISKKNRR